MLVVFSTVTKRRLQYLRGELNDVAAFLPSLVVKPNGSASRHCLPTKMSPYPLMDKLQPRSSFVTHHGYSTSVKRNVPHKSVNFLA